MLSTRIWSSAAPAVWRMSRLPGLQHETDDRRRVGVRRSGVVVGSGVDPPVQAVSSKRSGGEQGGGGEGGATKHGGPFGEIIRCWSDACGRATRRISGAVR